MIQYHGTPITPNSAALAILEGHHAMVSFAHSQQVRLMAEICESFALDNGAFSFWKTGKKVNWKAYGKWAAFWYKHPGCDWAIIPDVIEGSEEENDDLIAWWDSEVDCLGVPVFHLHEKLDRLCRLSHDFGRIALGSSGPYRNPGTPQWWERMTEVWRVLCNFEGQPCCKVHGLRMLQNTIVSHCPFSSADSTNIARNINIDKRWVSAYAPKDPATRGIIIRERMKHHGKASRWNFLTTGAQINMDLLG